MSQYWLDLLNSKEARLYAENTFKGSKWTVFGQGACGGRPKSPFAKIAFQCPRGVAEDIMRKGGLDPNYETCHHCGVDWNVYEDVEDPAVFISHNIGHTSILVFGYSCIGYLDARVWKLEDWLTGKQQ